MKPKAVCAWCTKVLHEGSHPDAPVSHDICVDCLLKYFGLTPADFDTHNTRLREEQRAKPPMTT